MTSPKNYLIEVPEELAPIQSPYIIINRDNNKDIDDFWSSIMKATPYLTGRGVSLLKQRLAKTCKTVIIEKNYICKDYRNIYSNYYSKKFSPPAQETSRLHFFTKKFKTLDALHTDVNIAKNDYIGFSIIRDAFPGDIGRTVLDPDKLSYKKTDNFYSLKTDFRVNFYGVCLWVKGYPYMSQDTELMTCAQVTMWGVCRYLSERYSRYKELYPYELVQMSGGNQGRKFPYRGLTWQDYIKILSEFGTYPVCMPVRHSPDELGHKESSSKKEREEKQKIWERDFLNSSFFNDLYTYVESGFPVITSFRGHVATIIGHTLTEDESTYEKIDKEFYDCSNFIDNYIVMDDHYTPYSHLPKETKRDINYSFKDIRSVVCPIPEKIYLGAGVAREFALAEFKDLREYLEMETGKKNWIFRHFATTGSSFQKRKQQYYRKSKDKLANLATLIKLPHFIWCTELYTEEGHKDGNCCAELIIDATGSTNTHSIIYIRIGNILFYQDKIKKHNRKCKTFRQYTHNLGEK